MDTFSTPPGNNRSLLPLFLLKGNTNRDEALCVGVGFSIHWLCFAALWPAAKRDDYKEGVLLFSTYAAQHFATWTACCRRYRDSEGAIIHIYTSACSAISYFYTVCACKLSFRADYHCLWSIHAGVAVLCPIPVQEVMVLFLFCTTVGRINDRPSAILVVCGWWWRPVVHSTFLGLIRLSWHWSYNRADRLNMYFHCHLSAMCIEDRSCGFEPYSI